MLLTGIIRDRIFGLVREPEVVKVTEVADSNIPEGLGFFFI